MLYTCNFLYSFFIFIFLKNIHGLAEIPPTYKIVTCVVQVNLGKR